jgi:hypothetical protein
MWNPAFFSLPSETKFSLQFQISLPKRKWGRTLIHTKQSNIEENAILFMFLEKGRNEEISRLCPETSTKMYFHEFHLRKLLAL